MRDNMTIIKSKWYNKAWKPKEDLLLLQFEFFWNCLNSEGIKVIAEIYEQRGFLSDMSYLAVDALAAMDEG
jgi:hypothetical protein